MPKYLSALSEATGGTFKILGVRYGDELVGGVALYEERTRLGSFIYPRPLIYYNGIILRRYDTRYPSERTARQLKILQAIQSSIAQMGYAQLILASPSSLSDMRSFLAAGWKVYPRYSYVVDIRDLDVAWNRIDQNLRRLVKRCERESMNFNDHGSFDAFLDLHASIMTRRSHGLYLPPNCFREFYRKLNDASLCDLHEARSPSGEVIASQLVLLGGNSVCHIAAAATAKEHQSTGVTAFLRWRSFQVLSRLGYSAVDLTDAGLNSVAHFKSQLGGDLETTLVLEAPRTAVSRTLSKVKSLFDQTKTTLRFLVRSQTQ
ncbi:MAG: GNAT family N-acetyltransferase [Hyphomicrobium sp.]|uniref:GNAT family N-acetyltransferase n=1 Tax=Hyphomicrobium sp. TaxID=82 RepID=UPI0039E215AD